MGVLEGAGVNNTIRLTETESNALSTITSNTQKTTTTQSSLSNMLSKVVAKTILNSSSSIESILKANNTIKFSRDPRCPLIPGEVNIKNITQTNTVNITAVLNSTVKAANDI